MANKLGKMAQHLSHQVDANGNHTVIPLPHLPEWPQWKRLTTAQDDKDVEQLKFSFPAGYKVNLYNSSGKLFDSIYLS